MALYLVVAHETAGSEVLIEELRHVAETDAEAEFVLLVPATSARHLWTWTGGDEQENARRSAGVAATAMRRAGLQVRETSIGPSDPMRAIEAELTQTGRDYEAVIVSTLPPGLSRWLRQDLPNQVRHHFSLPVISVISSARAERRLSEARARLPAVREETSWVGSTLQELARLRGSEVHCSDGTAGRMTEILYDYVTLEPVWLGIASRPIPFRTLLIPAQLTHIEAGQLRVPFTRDKVLGQPHIDIGEGIPSLTDEERIYAYFGVPHDTMREVRVLHQGDDLPGSIQSWQPIFDRDYDEKPERTA